MPGGTHPSGAPGVLKWGQWETPGLEPVSWGGLGSLLLCRVRGALPGGTVWHCGRAQQACSAQGPVGGQTWDSPEVVMEGSRAHVTGLSRGPSIVDRWLEAGQHGHKGAAPSWEGPCFFQKCSLGPSRSQT